MENKKVLTHPHMREIPYIYMGHLIYVFCWRLKIILTDETVIDRIYTKALADRILSSVQGSKNLRVKPGFPVRIFYLFKMSSKKVDFAYIYIYTKSLIFWAYKLWKYISELFYLLDPCIYIWFSAFSMVYFIRWRMNINKINNFISIYSSKKESSLVSLVCWNILSVGFMYIYI